MKGVRVDMDTVTNVVQALRAGDMHTEISDRFRISQSMISLIARRHGLGRVTGPRLAQSPVLRSSMMRSDEGLSGADEDRRCRDERARAESMWPVLLLGERFDEKGRGHRA